jgi:uncharacterized small protein (DUF1192 family)
VDNGTLAPFPPDGLASSWRVHLMGNESSLSLPELSDRIAILQDNIRQLVEQGAGASGERNEERVADRLSMQNEELERLIKERDSRSKS